MMDFTPRSTIKESVDALGEALMARGAAKYPGSGTYFTVGYLESAIMGLPRVLDLTEDQQKAMLDHFNDMLAQQEKPL